MNFLCLSCPLLSNRELLLKTNLLESGSSISNLFPTGIVRIWFSSASLQSPWAHPTYRGQIGVPTASVFGVFLE